MLIPRQRGPPLNRPCVYLLSEQEVICVQIGRRNANKVQIESATEVYIGTAKAIIGGGSQHSGKIVQGGQSAEIDDILGAGTGSEILDMDIAAIAQAKDIVTATTVHMHMPGTGAGDQFIVAVLTLEIVIATNADQAVIATATLQVVIVAIAGNRVTEIRTANGFNIKDLVLVTKAVITDCIGGKID